MGNLLGDFVKGTPESLRERYPGEVLHGILMHRHLDRFTDEHPAFKEARTLLSPRRRRFAGIIVDVLFDHFLAVHWNSFSALPLPEFIEEMYATLTRQSDWLTEDLRAILPRMQKENWLQSYATLSGLEETFARISSRSQRTAIIAGSVSDLTTRYQSFDQAFHRFFPDVQERSAELLARDLFPREDDE